MTETNFAPEQYGASDFLSPENIERADATVTEILAMMFGIAVEVIPTPIPTEPGEFTDRTAIVGFSGSMRGSCQVQMSSAAAAAIASAMLGGTPVEEDDSIDDALGELCNMLAGGWKNGIPSLAAECALSPPTVISGRDYKVHVTKPSTKFSRSYKFDAHTFCLTLHHRDES